MAEPKVYKTTTVARAKAASSKARSAEKKAFREAEPWPKEILSVRCPTCGAASGEKCKLCTGPPRTAPHRDRRLTAKDLVWEPSNPPLGHHLTKASPVSSYKK
jgi:hypothetical protein